MSDNTSTVFTPLDCLREDTKAKFVLILLNHDGSDLAPSLQLFQRIWKNALLKAVVDGGTNLLYKNTSDSNEFIPDFISGDFDSAKPELLQFYRDKGCDIINTPDQDATDFTKALEIMAKKVKEQNLKVDFFVTVGGYGASRFDHTMANIDTLFRAPDITRGVPVHCVMGKSFFCLLQKGKSSIHVNTGFEDFWCGLIPIGAPCNHVTTTGLKWDLCDNALKFGDLISTSNTWTDSETITVETDMPLVWTMGIKM